MTNLQVETIDLQELAASTYRRLQRTDPISRFGKVRAKYLKEQVHTSRLYRFARAFLFDLIKVEWELFYLEGWVEWNNSAAIARIWQMIEVEKRRRDIR